MRLGIHSCPDTAVVWCHCTHPHCLPPLLSYTSHTLQPNHRVHAQWFVDGRFVSASHPLTGSPGKIKVTHTSRLETFPNLLNLFHWLFLIIVCLLNTETINADFATVGGHDESNERSFDRCQFMDVQCEKWSSEFWLLSNINVVSDEKDDAADGESSWSNDMFHPPLSLSVWLDILSTAWQGLRHNIL